MNRKLIIFYYIVSILFFLFFILFAGYRYKTTIDKNFISVKRTFDNLKLSALSAYLAEGDFNSEYFKIKMKNQFEKTDRILLLSIYSIHSIHSKKNGILYLLAKNHERLINPVQTSSKPEYQINPIFEINFSSPFAPGIQSDLFIECLFNQFNRKDIYTILKEFLYIMLAYILLSGIILLVISTSNESPAFTPQKPTHSFKLFSSETGMGLEEHLEQKLGFELQRAASFDQDMALILIALDNPKYLENAGHVYKQLGKLILESFPFKDLAFEYGQSAFSIILPDRNLDQALRDAALFQKRAASKLHSVSLSVGISARNGRLINKERLLTEAEKSLNQSQKSGGNQITAFRADPDKFRKIIAQESRR